MFDNQNNTFAYRDAARPAVALDILDLNRLSIMNETLTDLLYINLLLETRYDENVLYDGNIVKVKPDKLPPDYLEEVFGDVRATSSFFRHDKARLWAGVYPANKRGAGFCDASDLADTEHDIIRKTPGNVGKHFVKRTGEGFEFPLLPESATEARNLSSDFFKLLDEYRLKLLPGAGTRGHHETIASQAMADFNERLQKTYAALEKAYIDIPSFSFSVEGVNYSISNERLPDLNEEIKKSYPLLVMFFLTNVGKMALDKDKYPPAALNCILPVVGEASQIVDVVRLLAERFESAGASLSKELQFDTTKLKENLQKDSRSLKLLYHFHRILNRAYPSALQDIKDRLNFIGETPEITALETPKEMAVMLYATAKRIEQDTQIMAISARSKLKTNANLLIRDILRLADKVAKSPDIVAACETVEQKGDVWRAMQRCTRALGDDCNSDTHQAHGLRLIEKTLIANDVALPACAARLMD